MASASPAVNTRDAAVTTPPIQEDAHKHDDREARHTRERAWVQHGEEAARQDQRQQDDRCEVQRAQQAATAQSLAFTGRHHLMRTLRNRWRRERQPPAPGSCLPFRPTKDISDLIVVENCRGARIRGWLIR